MTHWRVIDDRAAQREIDGEPTTEELLRAQGLIPDYSAKGLIIEVVDDRMEGVRERLAQLGIKLVLYKRGY